MADVDPHIPPQNLEAEASLLGSLLIDGDAYAKVGDRLAGDDFYELRHQQIFEAIKTLNDKRKPIDVLTLSEQLKSIKQLEAVGGASFLTELTNFVPTAAHVEQYADIVTDKSFRRRLIKATRDIAQIGFEENKSLQEFIDETSGITVSDLRTKARRQHHQQPLAVIMVDYLQLMSGGSRFATVANRVQEISEISRGLKILARELNVPVVALSQLSRSVENRHPQIPQLADLRESGSIEQDADVVVFIYREDYYNPETDRQNITSLMIKKHRNGPTGNVDVYFDRSRQRFNDLETKHDPSADS